MDVKAFIETISAGDASNIVELNNNELIIKLATDLHNLKMDRMNELELCKDDVEAEEIADYIRKILMAESAMLSLILRRLVHHYGYTSDEYGHFRKDE